MSQTPCKYRQDGNTISYTPVSAVTAGDVIVLGTLLVCIALRDIAANVLGALAVRGVFDVPKVTGAISAGDPLYWDADGDPVGGTAGSGAFTATASNGTFAGFATADAASGDETVSLSLQSRDSAVAVARGSLVQDDLKSYPVPVDALRVWDAPHTNAVGTPANDDLGIVYNTFLTAPPSIETGDLKAAGATTRKVGFQFAVPPEYVAGQTITLRANAGMKTTVSDGTATIDFQVARQAAPTVDLCATAAQSINSLTAANKDFEVTATDVVPGDILDVVCSVAVSDAATATAVIGKIKKLELLLDIKG